MLSPAMRSKMITNRLIVTTIKYSFNKYYVHSCITVISLTFSVFHLISMFTFITEKVSHIGSCGSICIFSCVSRLDSCRCPIEFSLVDRYLAKSMSGTWQLGHGYFFLNITSTTHSTNLKQNSEQIMYQNGTCWCNTSSTPYYRVVENFIVTSAIQWYRKHMIINMWFYITLRDKYYGKRYFDILYGINSINNMRCYTWKDSITQITRYNYHIHYL